MGTRRGSGTLERDLSERQRFWLKHVRTAERKDEPRLNVPRRPY